MRKKLLKAIRGAYSQKVKRAEIINLVLRYYRRSLQHPMEHGLWSKLYAGGPVGKRAHSAASDYLTGMSRRCCYCHEKIFHKANVNIDHILPRDKYPQFTFWPENLAAACVTCNAIKSNSDYFSVNGYEIDYRRLGQPWQCFHPNFHVFHDHLELLVFQTNHFHVRAFVGTTREGKALCTNLLSKLTEYSVKSIVNKEVDMAVSGLQFAVSKAGSVSMPNVKKLIADLIQHI